VLVGPGSGVAGAALSTTDWHQAEKDAEIAEKYVEIFMLFCASMNLAIFNEIDARLTEFCQ
jgi:hypothetical protein